MQSYHIWTIGCQMNKADSERLESALDQMGLASVPEPEDADVIVLNSCVVRQSSEDKVVGMLSRLRSQNGDAPDRVLALMGCMVGPDRSTLESRFPHVDVFMRPQEYRPLLDIVGERTSIDPEGCLENLTARTAVTAFVPIIHGCDKFCTFCIIPYRRGREVSRPIPDLVHEAELLGRRGVKEITLLGQNVDSYGHDLVEQTDLGDLLEAVSKVESIQRIRFLTSHPNDMSDRIIDRVAELDKVCEHINLPFQAGDDEVLSKMRRGYTADEYLTLVEKIRERIPGVSLTTDLIVGFCGETEKQFERSLDMIRNVRFDKVHSAAYSTRKGTIADRKLEDDVPLAEKKARLKTIDDLQATIQTDINRRLLDRTFDVLLEGTKRGKIHGRNRNDKLVYVNEGSIGEIVQVQIDETSPWSLQGTLISQN